MNRVANIDSVDLGHTAGGPHGGHGSNLTGIGIGNFGTAVTSDAEFQTSNPMLRKKKTFNSEEEKLNVSVMIFII